MKLKDVRQTVINTQKLTFLNDSALDVEKKKLTIILDTVRYSLDYDKQEDLLNDYKELYSKIEGM